MNKDIMESFDKLKTYCEAEGFKGWDPYDGLNSKLFKALKLDKIKFLRLAWIQIFKRSPINFRKWALVPKEYNPKGLGLFLTGYANLYKKEGKEEYLEKIHFLAKQLIALQSRGFSGACWGYNFDWQSRAFFLPKETPTVVATSFIASALMDAYDITNEQQYLDVALSSANFIVNDLNRTSKEDGFIFSYSPFDNTCVYNASLLGSKLLARIYSYNKDETLLALARDSVLACVRAQRDDGAWIYGEMGIQDWVDSFHTGYNLECISDYQKYSGDTTFQQHIDKGLDYYLKHFFLKNGTPKYYDNKTYPIDIHAPAQLVATLSRLDVLEEHKEIVNKVLKWTIMHMQDKEKGYFYYQLKQGISSKIPYMRWAQAWMFYAFTFLGEENTNDS